MWKTEVAEICKYFNEEPPGLLASNRELRKLVGNRKNWKAFVSKNFPTEDRLLRMEIRKEMRESLLMPDAQASYFSFVFPNHFFDAIFLIDEVDLKDDVLRKRVVKHEFAHMLFERRGLVQDDNPTGLEGEADRLSKLDFELWNDFLEKIKRG